MDTGRRLGKRGGQGNGGNYGTSAGISLLACMNSVGGEMGKCGRHGLEDGKKSKLGVGTITLNHTISKIYF